MKKRKYSPCVVTNMVECKIVVSEFEFQSCNYVIFRNIYSWERYGLLSPTIEQIVRLLYFYKDSFDLKKPSLICYENKETVLSFISLFTAEQKKKKKKEKYPPNTPHKKEKENKTIGTSSICVNTIIFTMSSLQSHVHSIP